MRTREDALRSVRRYIYNAMGGKPWRVRMEMDARFKRPFAMVAPAAPSPSNMVSVSASREALPLTVQLYPEEPSARGPMRATEARMAAERAGELLFQALTYGVPDLEDATVRGHQDRIPLWDYTDDAGNPLPLEGPNSVATRRTRSDYLDVGDGWTIHVQPQASSEQLFVCIASLRVEWLRASQLRPTGPELASVAVQLNPS